MVHPSHSLDRYHRAINALGSSIKLTMMKRMIVLWVLAPTLAWSESTCDFDYLKSELPNIYAKIVEKTDTLPKVFSFCDNEYHYLFNVSMFQKFNNGQGITRSLEKDLFSYLLEEFDANSYSRTSLMVRKDQQLELVTTVTNRHPFKAEEIIQEVFIDEKQQPRITYGNLAVFERPQSIFAKFFEPTTISEEDRLYLEKFKPFLGLHRLN